MAQTSAPSDLRDRKVAAIVLGAARFPHWPAIDDELAGTALGGAHRDVVAILRSFTTALLDRFDSEDLPSQLCLDIEDFLAKQRDATDLVVYYVGHGSFLDDGELEYFLALRKTAIDRQYATGLRSIDLARSLKVFKKRTYLLLDCCFAGSALPHFQSPLQDVIGAQFKPNHDPKGIALLSAASRNKAAIIPKGAGRTMFSDALCDVLERGIVGAGPFLSLRQLKDAIIKRIETKYGSQPRTLPEVHTPRQIAGDVADYDLFPNPAAPLANPAREERGARRVDPSDRPAPAAPTVRQEAAAEPHPARGPENGTLIPLAAVEPPDATERKNPDGAPITQAESLETTGRAEGSRPPWVVFTTLSMAVAATAIGGWLFFRGHPAETSTEGAAHPAPNAVVASVPADPTVHRVSDDLPVQPPPEDVPPSPSVGYATAPTPSNHHPTVSPPPRSTPSSPAPGSPHPSPAVPFAGCKSNEDCKGGRICRRGSCASAGCLSNDDCKGGRTCVDGECASPPAAQGCQSDTDCKGNRKCVGGVCAAPQ